MSHRYDFDRMIPCVCCRLGNGERFVQISSTISSACTTAVDVGDYERGTALVFCSVIAVLELEGSLVRSTSSKLF